MLQVASCKSSINIGTLRRNIAELLSKEHLVVFKFTYAIYFEFITRELFQATDFGL